MLKYLYRFLSHVCFGKTKKLFRSKYKNLKCIPINENFSEDFQKDDIYKNNFIDIPNENVVCLEIKGKNNKVKVSKKIDTRSRINLKIYGDNNNVEINSRHCFINLTMGYNDGRLINDAIFKCLDTWINGLSVLMIENNTSVNIGRGGQFASGIEMRCTDDHAILFDGKVINKAKDIIVGDHVWIGKDVLILKNSNIPNGCVVGARSVVAKKFEKENSVIVGNPARIVKENISWNHIRPDLYIEK